MGNQLHSALALVLLAGAHDAQVPEIHGRIVDTEGKPAANVELTECWLFRDPGGEHASEPAHSYTGTPLATDEDGAFVYALDPGQFFFALDPKEKQGALVPLDRDGPTTLQPLVEVRGRFEIRSAGDPPTKSALWAGPIGPGAPLRHVAGCISTSHEVRVWLPPGEYRLWSSTDAISLSTSEELDVLTVEAGRSVDLGTLPIEIPLIARPQGVVLDPQGDPFPGAAVGTEWTSHEGVVFPVQGASTDEHGRFRLAVEINDVEREQPLLVLGPGGTLGAATTWSPKSPGPELTLRLSPTARVHGRFVVSGTSAAPEWMYTYVSLLPQGLRLGPVSKSGELDLRLPPGSYRLDSYGADVEKVSRDLELSAGQDVDLGTIDLTLDVIARLSGQEAPAWTLTDARGIDKGTKLSDLRGKWVLLEFWGYW